MNISAQTKLVQLLSKYHWAQTICFFQMLFIAVYRCISTHALQMLYYMFQLTKQQFKITDRRSTSTNWHKITIICYWQLWTVHLQSPFLVNAWIQLDRRHTVFRRWCTDFLHFKPHEHFVDNLYSKHTGAQTLQQESQFIKGC